MFKTRPPLSLPAGRDGGGGRVETPPAAKVQDSDEEAVARYA